MKYPNLANDLTSVSTGLDSVTIRHYLAGKTGGATLDVEGFPDEVIKAGHIVIKNTTTGEYKPLGVENGAYAALPAGYEYAGVTVCSATKDKPIVGIMYAGEVNDMTVPYPVASIKEALKVALPQLTFDHD